MYSLKTSAALVPGDLRPSTSQFCSRYSLMFFKHSCHFEMIRYLKKRCFDFEYYFLKQWKIGTLTFFKTMNVNGNNKKILFCPLLLSYEIPNSFIKSPIDKTDDFLFRIQLIQTFFSDRFWPWWSEERRERSLSCNVVGQSTEEQPAARDTMCLCGEGEYSQWERSARRWEK